MEVLSLGLGLGDVGIVMGYGLYMCVFKLMCNVGNEKRVVYELIISRYTHRAGLSTRRSTLICKFLARRIPSQKLDML